MQVVLYQSEGGGVGVLVYTPTQMIDELVGYHEGEEIYQSRPMTIEEMALRCVPVGVEYAAFEVDELDRTFRAAWEFSVNGLVINMANARAIWRNKMRFARAPLLKDLDVAYQRADETNNAALKAQIVARKNALRDVTADPAIEAAQTPDQLKAVWPEVLG